MKKFLSLLLFTTTQLYAFGNNIVAEGIYISKTKTTALKIVKDFPELTISNTSPEGFEVYGPKGLSSWATTMGLRHVLITEEAIPTLPIKSTEFNDDPHSDYFPPKPYYDGYPSNEENYQTLKELEQQYPKILKLFSIGQSIEGRELWVMKISDNVEIDEIEPEFKYIANMHGNEITGREMLIRLIKDLAKGYYSFNLRYRKLINNTEIFIMPTMNPDGNSRHQRGNSANVDLNRDFPDFIKDPTNTIDDRQPETIAVMEFQASRHFALSANLHDGTSVINYPWDSTKEKFPMDNLARKLSLEYASPISDMHSMQFPDGVTNGAEWYVIHGGMQDWSYYWYGDLQITIEVSRRKWPAFDKIDSFYTDHKKSLIKYMERIHHGAGFKFKQPDISGMVSIEKITPLKKSDEDYGTYGFNSSEFYKALDIGVYRFTVTTQNGQVLTFLRVVSGLPPFLNGNYKKLKMPL